MYTVSSFWALAHCALSRHHIFHLVGSGTLESPHTFPCCLLKVLLITKPQPSQGFFFKHHFGYVACDKGSQAHKSYNELVNEFIWTFQSSLLCPFLSLAFLC